MAAKKICPNCRGANPVAQSFCGLCGRSLTDALAAPQPVTTPLLRARKKMPDRSRIIVLGIFVGFALFVSLISVVSLCMALIRTPYADAPPSPTPTEVYAPTPEPSRFLPAATFRASDAPDAQSAQKAAREADAALQGMDRAEGTASERQFVPLQGDAAGYSDNSGAQNPAAAQGFGDSGLHTGPRGGVYHMSSGGNKVYESSGHHKRR